MKFTIITAVYNNAAHLESALKSVLGQTYANLEYIVIDGGSTDGCVDILRQAQDDLLRSGGGRTGQAQDDTLRQAQGDRKFKWISEPDNGIYEALNKGIRLASGDVIGILHSDDVFTDEHVIEKVAAIFEKRNAHLLYSDLEYIDKNNKTFRKWRSGKFKSLRFGWMPPHPTLFVKKSLFDKYGLYDTRLQISSDYEMVLRLFGKENLRVSYLPEVTVKMRTGGASNRSIGNIVQKSREDYLALKSNHMALPFFTLLCKNVRKVGQFV
ncbi:MAG TPA: glycosyltransferase family 2 protein [Thermodesulfobacteriota bacterium]|nr:glycosyltransferase family 2 protein [Thermodesulfobacteriota bacterium]